MTTAAQNGGTLRRRGRLAARHKLLLALALAGVLGGLAVTPAARAWFGSLEGAALDARFLLRGPRDTAALPILLVLIDDRALEAHGFRSPTPRTLVAELVAALAARGAACIGLDFIFDRPHLPVHDERLERALAGSAAPVRIVEPALARFARHAPAAASLVHLDSRERARAYQLWETREGERRPTLAGSLLGACGFTGAAPSAWAQADVALLNLYGPPSASDAAQSTFAVITASEAMQAPEALVRGRAVLVGSGVMDLGDHFQTAFSTAAAGHRPTFGAELHAVALAMLLEDRPLLEPGAAATFPGAALLVLLTTLAVLFLPLRWSLPLSGLAGAAWLVVAVGLFMGGGWVLPVVAPLLALALAVLTGQVVLYYTERRHARFLQSTFSRYISPEIVRDMVERGWGLDLGGESREVTVLFSDLEGFTTLSERLQPREVVQLLNEYLGAMTAVLFEARGTIGDFIGDAIMAYFGAPESQPDHAARACRCALGMQAALARLNAEWAERGLPPLRARIGIHTGEVVLGNIGSERRTDFTIIGDTVNLASRLEGANKFFGTQIIASGATLARTGGALASQELARIVVKGKSKPIAIHELSGNGAGPGGRGTMTDYGDALRAFYAGDLARAAAGFDRVAASGAHPPARFMAGQVQRLLADGAPQPWQGTVTLTEK